MIAAWREIGKACGFYTVQPVKVEIDVRGHGIGPTHRLTSARGRPEKIEASVPQRLSKYLTYNDIRSAMRHMPTLVPRTRDIETVIANDQAWKRAQTLRTCIQSPCGASIIKRS